MVMVLFLLSVEPAPVLRALAYGKSSFPVRLLDGTQETSTAREPLDWLFYVVETGSARVLVDAGMQEQADANGFNLSRFTPTSGVLEHEHIDPSTVTHVILTHAHVDHAGGAHLFKNAAIVLQQAEWPAFQRSRPFLQHEAFYKQAGRMLLVEGDAVIVPGVSVTLAGGHTRGSQAVLAGDDVIVGDECYTQARCANATPLPRGAVVDAAANKRFLRRVQGWLKEGRRVLTLHEQPAPSTSTAPSLPLQTGESAARPSSSP